MLDILGWLWNVFVAVASGSFLPHEFAVGLNRLGILFGVISGILLTPTIVGEQRLKKAETVLAGGFGGVGISLLASGISWLLLFVLMVVLIIVVELIGIAVASLGFIAAPNYSATPGWMLWGAFAVGLIIVLLLNYRFGNLFIDRVYLPQLKALIDDQQRQKKWQLWGGILFFASFVIQFLATY